MICSNNGGKVPGILYKLKNAASRQLHNAIRIQSRGPTGWVRAWVRGEVPICRKVDVHTFPSGIELWSCVMQLVTSLLQQEAVLMNSIFTSLNVYMVTYHVCQYTSGSSVIA